MKKTILTTLLFVGLLVGCANTSSSDTEPLPDVSGSSETSNTSGGGETSNTSGGGTVTKPPVVISEVYGGGGNSGSTYKSDFIELYNNSDAVVSLDGWAVWYASATGSFRDDADLTYDQKTILSGSIQPRSYYLIKQADGTGGTTALPTPDATGGINMSATNFKVILTNTSTVPETSLSASNLIDFVGAGTANLAEGNPAPAPANDKSIARSLNGTTMVDTNDNSADFVAGTPTPKNSK